MANDGKVIISTELDNSGIEKGLDKISGMLGGMKSVLKEIADAVVTAFAFSRIVDFAVESSQAAMTLSDALNGLQSILEGQGRSFSAAQAFIEEYTKDGLIPATNAITAYKNLAMRGYDDSQIQQVMQALKDASAYGRQASFTMGEAVESATEGLKNENSILVDNAGVTKNVAKMWEEYAASIGTTANNLTQQQKIQAEVTGILEESKYQAGDAATVAGTLSGQLLQLSFNFNNLKIAVGNAINPFIQTVLPIINSVIVAFTRLANAVATVVGILFGKATVQTAALAEQNDSVASSASEGAKAEKKLADNTKAAGKAAKRALASFDELNILQFGGGGNASTTGPDTGPSSSGNTVTGIEVEDTVSPKLQAVANIVREVIGAFGQLADLVTGKISFSEFAASLTPLQSVLLGIAAALIAIISASAFLKVADFISGLIKTVNALNATSFIGKFAEFFALLAGAAGPVTSLSEVMQVAFGSVATKIAGIAAIIGGAVLAATNFFAMLSNGFSWLNEALMVVGIAISAVGAIILGAPAVVAGVVAAIVAAVATMVVLITTYGDSIKTALDQFSNWLQNVFCRDWTEVFGVKLGTLLNFFVGVVGGALGGLKEMFFGLIDIVQGVFTGNWEQAFDGLVGIAKGAVNGIIGIINGMIRAVADGINSIIKAVNKLSFTVPDWIPGIGGSKLGFNLKTVSYPQIPYLAKGAVLPANKPFLAMVGDQRHGTNIEAPLSTIQEAVAIVMEDHIQAMMAGFEALLEENRELRRTVEEIEVGDETIWKANNRFERKMAVVRGG